MSRAPSTSACHAAKVFDQLAESCVVQSGAEPVQVRQPAERAGVGAQRPQTLVCLGSRAIDCIDAEQTCELVECFGDRGVLG